LILPLLLLFFLLMLTNPLGLASALKKNKLRSPSGLACFGLAQCTSFLCLATTKKFEAASPLHQSPTYFTSSIVLHTSPPQNTHPRTQGTRHATRYHQLRR
jgi:hypothetical protein